MGYNLSGGSYLSGEDIAIGSQVGVNDLGGAKISPDGTKLFVLDADTTGTPTDVVHQ